MINKVIYLFFLLFSILNPFTLIFAESIVINKDKNKEISAESKDDEILTYKDIWKAFGPLQVRNQSVLKFMSLSWLPDTPDILPIGEYRFSFAITHSNHWGQMPTYLLDAETTKYSMRFTLGVTSHFEIEAEYSAFWRGGGFLDGFIENFHKLIGESPVRRDKYPRDCLNFILNPGKPNEKIVLSDSDEGFGLGDLILKAKYQLIDPDRYRPGISVALLMKLPVGDASRKFSVRAGEFGSHLSIMQKLGSKIWVYAAIGLNYTSADEIWSVQVEPWRWFWFIGFEWRCGYHFSLNLQYEWESGSAYGHEYDMMLGWSSNLIAIGFKWRPDLFEDYYFEFAIVENTFFHSNTPDITFHLAFHIQP